MLTALIAGCCAVGAVGCVHPRERVEYIPGDHAVVPLKKGDPAPAEGWFVPPAAMQDMVPCLDDRFEKSSPGVAIEKEK